MSKKIFKEKQRFFSRNFTLTLAALCALAVWIVVRQYLNPQFHIHLVDIVAGSGVALLIVGILWFAQQLRMKTAITPKGIEYKMAPFHHNKRVIPWDEIKSIQVVSIPRYASWQSSYNNYMLQRKFTFSGRNGISVETCDGDFIFIGSHKVDELREAIERAQQKYDLSVCA